MNKNRMMLLTGILIGALLFEGVSLFGVLYREFSRDGYQTFEIMIANDLFREDVVMPEDIEALTHTYSETTRWVMSRALAMKNGANLKKLAIVLSEFNKADEEYYIRWFQKRRLKEERSASYFPF